MKAAEAAVRAEFVVVAARLEPGEWSHDLTRRVGEGDVQASYSADLIAAGKVRRPFKLGRQSWVAVGMVNRETRTATAYRLVPADEFAGETTAYADRTEGDHAAAREHPRGFYHGLTVRRGARAYVLAGPPATIRGSDEPPRFQRELF